MISLMAAVMAVQAALIYQVENHTVSASGAGIAAAAMLFIFQGAFTVGFQATVWVYPYVRKVTIVAHCHLTLTCLFSRSEILPLRLRQRGSSISTAANWMWNYVGCELSNLGSRASRTGLTDSRSLSSS